MALFFNLVFHSDTINQEVLGCDCNVKNLPCMCSLNFLLTYLITRINTRSGEGPLFIEGKHFAFTSQPYNDVNGLTGTKKTSLADLQIKQKFFY